MPETTTYLKVLSKENTACHGGTFDYTDYLPTQDGPGLMFPKRDPVLCRSGWHWCTPESLMDHWAKAGMQVYEAAPSDDVTALDDDGKCVSASGRLVRLYALPDWWTDAMRFVEEDIPATPWFTCQGEPNPAWQLFLGKDWSAARSAAESAAWSAARSAAYWAARSAAESAARSAARSAAYWAARSAAWSAARSAAESAAESAAWSAALYTSAVHICDGTDLDMAHVTHARARWDVWQRGYALLCDADGVLFVYGVSQ